MVRMETLRSPDLWEEEESLGTQQEGPNLAPFTLTTEITQKAAGNTACLIKNRFKIMQLTFSAQNAIKIKILTMKQDT